MSIITIIGMILFGSGSALLAFDLYQKGNRTPFVVSVGAIIIGFLMMVASVEYSQNYKAVVTDFNGNQTTYDVRRYYTNGSDRASATTMTLILEDGTKVVAPIQNVIITGQQKGD